MIEPILRDGGRAEQRPWTSRQRGKLHDLICIKCEIIQDSEDDEDEEAIRKEMADLIDSNEDLSDGIEYLQQKFRRDQAKSERELMKKVKAAAFAINKRTRY